MKHRINILVFACTLFVISSGVLFAEESRYQNLSMLRGYEAFQNEDWISALFFLRKAVSEAPSLEHAWYMLILSELYVKEYDQAVIDCKSYLTKFSQGEYKVLVEYQLGKSLYLQGNIEDAIAQLTYFCNEYPESSLYPSALYLLAESFYAGFFYDSSRSLYERLINNFPGDPRIQDAKNRLAAIDRVEREQKLLYLLKVTGEEYMAVKDNYEKQLHLYETEGAMRLQDQYKEKQKSDKTLEELNKKNQEQAQRIEQLEQENSLLQSNVQEVTAAMEEKMKEEMAKQAEKNVPDTSDFDELTKRAEVLKMMVEEKKQGGEE